MKINTVNNNAVSSNAKANTARPKYTLIITLWFLFLACAVPATALEVPTLRGRINDNAGVLTAAESETLRTMIINVENKTSSQIVLLIIPSLEGASLERFSMRVAEKWKLGQKQYDNGVLVLIAMKEKKIRIEVGYGLEHIITDIKSDYIIRKLMVKDFKKGRFFAGINSGLGAVGGLITKEFTISPQELEKFKKNQRKPRGRHLGVGMVVFIFIMIMSFFKNFSRFRGSSRRGHHGSSVIFWGGMGGSSHRSSGGFFGGGGGFSGGGGGFGGGGSSGGW